MLALPVVRSRSEGPSPASPLLIRDEARCSGDGEIVEPSDPEGIARALIKFYSSDKLKASRNEIASVTLISYPSRVETWQTTSAPRSMALSKRSVQERQGRDGEIVEPSDPEGIARALIKFYSSDKLKASRNESVAGLSAVDKGRSAMFGQSVTAKSRPLRSTHSSSIPLQIRQGRDGEIVEPSDPEGIARALIKFYSSG
jgi:glycosyltransferase involved in cell wall biosynthesis